MKLTFNKQFMVLMFLLLNCFASYAANEDLITKQITLKLTEAGTLPNKIASSEKNLVTNLKIIGEINGTDLRFIREMAGRDVEGHSTSGNLSVLDLSEARFVAGGDYYYCYSGHYYYTSNDIIGASVFSDCRSLTSVIIPSSVTEIGWGVFKYCRSLTSVNIPSSVTEIGEYAFWGCSSLTSVDIPSSVTSIGERAFYDCSGLRSIYVYAGTVPSTVAGAFEGCDSKNCTLYVPKGTYDAYWLTEWGYFENIVEFDAANIRNIVMEPEVQENARYAVNGQRLTAPVKGINLVKYNNGRVKKEIVK
jgi:hypothetical protein